MIQRIRHTDGSVHDIDHGGGPFGDDDIRLLKSRRFADPQGATPVAQATPMNVPGISVEQTRRNARYRARATARS